MNAPENIPSGDFADDEVVVRVINEMKFPVLDEGGVIGFVGLAQKNEGECDARGGKSIFEGERGESVAVRDPDMTVSLANRTEGSIVCGRDLLWFNELEVDKCVEIWGHVTRHSTIIDLGTLERVFGGSDVGGAE